MGSSEEDLVRGTYDMLNARKFDLLEGVISADRVLHDPQSPAVRGPQEYADLVRLYAESCDAIWQIEDVFSAGDRVAARLVARGTHVGEVAGVAPTGNTLQVDQLAVFRVADGKIAETWLVWDTLGFLRQIGVVPPSAG